MSAPKGRGLGFVVTSSGVEVATELDHARWVAAAKRAGWKVTEHGLLDDGTTQGPCARCGATHELYGANGNPLCESCRGAL